MKRKLMVLMIIIFSLASLNGVTYAVSDEGDVAGINSVKVMRK